MFAGRLLVGVDANVHTALVVVVGLLAHVADGWYGCPTAYLHYGKFILLVAGLHFLSKLPVAGGLGVAPVVDPLPVVEHQHVGPENLFAFWAPGQIFASHPVVVDLWQELILYYVAARRALQVVDAAVHLVYLLIREHPGRLAVHIGCHHKRILHPLANPLQQVETLVRLLLPINGQSGPVEAPEQVGVGFQKLGIGALVEVKLAPVGRVVVPESLIAPEVRQPRVPAHAGSGAHEKV